jgi:pimeloyl-ACP methyl ester carboxylesterase
MEPRIQYAKTSDGVSIAYCVLGEGTPLVYTSNVWGDLQWYMHDEASRRAVDAIVGSGWKVVRYDGRGTGSSDRDVTEFSLDARVRDLQAVVDHVGIERFVLCGYGQGGPAAIAYSVGHPERVSHLALVNSFASGSAYYDKIPAMRALINLRSMAQEEWEFFTITLASAATGFKDSARATTTARLFRRSMSPDAFVSYVEAAQKIDVTELLSLLRVATLVVQDSSGFDTEQLARELTSRIPDACFVSTDDYTEELHAFVLGRGMERRVVALPQLPSGTEATVRVPSGSVRTFAAGRYTVVRQLGEGAQKTVHLVHDTALDRHCALALLKTEAMDADGIFRIKREAQAMGSLTHPNIVIVYDVGEEDGRPYIVCEYIPGGDLQQELRRAAGPLPLDRALAIGQDVCRALAAAHQRGITHRDVKPGNIWLMEDGGAKLGDFGLAVAIDRSRLTLAGTAMGTAAYMAPEQAQGQPIDARTDLYSLGCLLYELATGRPPFIADDPIAVVSQHIHATPLQPSHYHPDVPDRLERLILRLPAKAQRDRPASAGEVLHELGEIAARK